MSTLEQDLANLNFEYLMLARECARSNPVEAAWVFGVERNQIDQIAGYSLEKIKELASITRTVLRLVPLQTPNDLSVSTHAALLLPVNSNTAGN